MRKAKVAQSNPQGFCFAIPKVSVEKYFIMYPKILFKYVATKHEL